MFPVLFIKVIFMMIRGRKLVLATHNVDKKKEMVDFFKHMDITILGLNDFPQIGDINETGTTLLENSLIKARTVHQITGLPSLGDDTGLEVDALDGKPGVYSARYAGLNCSYEDNVNKLLVEMESVSEKKRKACFRTVMTIVNQRKQLSTEGIVKGMIAMTPKGERGFGYDSIFQPEGHSCTFAQIGLEQKNKISHRGKALEKMREKLEHFYR